MKNIDAIQTLVGATGFGMMIFSFMAYSNRSGMFWLGLIFFAIGVSIWYARKLDGEK